MMLPFEGGHVNVSPDDVVPAVLRPFRVRMHYRRGMAAKRAKTTIARQAAKPECGIKVTRNAAAMEVYKEAIAAREWAMSKAITIRLRLSDKDKLVSGKSKCQLKARQLLESAGLNVDDLLERYDLVKQRGRAHDNAHEKRARAAYLSGLKAFSDYENEQRARDPHWTFDSEAILYPFLGTFARLQTPVRREPPSARDLLRFVDGLAFYQDSTVKRVICMDNSNLYRPPALRVRGTYRLATLSLATLALFSVVCGAAFKSPFGNDKTTATLDALIASESERLSKAQQRE